MTAEKGLWKVGDLVCPTDQDGNLLTPDPVRVVGVAERDGQLFYRTEGTRTSFPEDQLKPGGMMEHALFYAFHHGWPIHPLKPGKKTPILKGWPDKATTDPATIRGWYKKWPRANIGLVPGAAGLAVVDVDVKNGAAGPESWRELTTAHDIDDDTVINLTPSGGQHLVYRTNGATVGNSESKLAPGVDVKSTGGNIVLPPSILADGGQYAWDIAHHPDDRDPSDLPAPLLRLLLDIEKRRAAPAPSVEGDIAGGKRNTTLASLGGSMRRRGMSEGAILAALLAENETRCRPPLARAEVERIAASMASYAPATVATTMERKAKKKSFMRTDMGNAERLVYRHGALLHYCHPWRQWLVWNGKRWKPDDTAAVVRLAKETVRAIYREASRGADKTERERISRWAAQSEAKHKIQAMIDLARSEPGIPVLPEDLDRNKWLFNANNGMINLRTGELPPHDPDELITKITPVDYDPDAKAPRFDEFLDQIMAGKLEKIHFLQRYTGYALTGSTKEQKLVVAHGIGQNGKSTYAELITDMMGDYAYKAAMETFMRQTRPGSGARNDIAELEGRRFVTAVEGEEGRRLAESLIKELTGGDRITARLLYRNNRTFKPEFKLFLATNHKPEIRGTDLAMWRRVSLVPFDVTIPESEQNLDLPDELREELPGVLAWAVRGCLQWQHQGLDIPTEVKKATAAYQSEMDIVKAFLDDCCVLRTTAQVTVAELYITYTDWCAANGETAISKRAVGRRLRERGLTQKKGTGGARFWLGIGLMAGPGTSP